MTRPIAAPCNREPRQGRIVGPTLRNPRYEIAVNGNDRLDRARYDVHTWAARAHMAAQLAKQVTQ